MMKQKGHSEVSFSNLNNMLKNVGNSQFNFDVFKAAYDQDPKLKNLVTNFDKEKIEFKTSEVDDLPNGKRKDPNAVNKMAKRAVDLKDL